MKEFMEGENGESEIKLEKNFWSLQIALIWWLVTRSSKDSEKLTTFVSGSNSSVIDYVGLKKEVKKVKDAKVIPDEEYFFTAKACDRFGTEK